MNSARAAAAAGLALALVACGTSGAEEPSGDAAQRLQVVAAFYPLQWLAERVGGQDIDVVGLTPAGTEPHDLQIAPPARRALESADVVVYLGQDYQPDVERALGTLDGDARQLDLLDSKVDLLPSPVEPGSEPLADGDDPHIWLDPVRMQTMAELIATELVAADADLADGVAARLAAVRADLEELDAELTGALANCARRTVVTSHAAFGYLTDRYELEQVAIAGLNPDAEPDPATLREIGETARAAGVTTVFVEEALPPALAETVASEIGARTDLLGVLEFDPGEAVGAGEDYLSVQRRNAAALARGLGCR